MAKGETSLRKGEQIRADILEVLALCGHQGIATKDLARELRMSSGEAVRYHMQKLIAERKVCWEACKTQDHGKRWKLIEFADGAPQQKSRRCLCCGHPFLSEHFGNRLCDGCRGRANHMPQAVDVSRDGKVGANRFGGRVFA